MNKDFLQPKFEKVMLRILCIISFTLIFVNLWLEKSNSAYTLIVVFVICLLFLNVELLQSLKLSPEGLEARLKSTLDRADITLKQFQNIAKVSGQIMITNIARTNRLIHNEEELLKWMNDIKNLLIEIGLPEQDCNNMLDEWHRLIEYDYVRSMLGGGYRESEDLLESKDAKKDRDELEKLEVRTSPEELTAFVEKNGFLSDKIKERIEDYRFYLENRRHRRPTEWKKHESWRLTD